MSKTGKEPRRTAEVWNISYARAPQRDGWRAYSKSRNPLPTQAGFEPSGYVGEVFRCPETRQAVCGGCGRWHGYTHTAQVDNFPELNIFGMSTRDDATRALYAIRVAWAQTLGAGE